MLQGKSQYVQYYVCMYVLCMYVQYYAGSVEVEGVALRNRSHVCHLMCFMYGLLHFQHCAVVHSACSLFKTYFPTCFGHSTILRKIHSTKMHSTTSVRKKNIS